MVLGFKLRPPALNHASSRFCSGYFGTMVSLYPRPTWTSSSYFTLPTRAKMTGTHHHTQQLVEMGSHELFAQAGLLLISASQTASITGMHHWHLASNSWIYKFIWEDFSYSLFLQYLFGPTFLSSLSGALMIWILFISLTLRDYTQDPRRCIKPQILPNSVFTVHFPIHAYVW
jgi:hypothetical protein